MIHSKKKKKKKGKKKAVIKSTVDLILIHVIEAFFFSLFFFNALIRVLRNFPYCLGWNARSSGVLRTGHGRDIDFGLCY